MTYQRREQGDEAIIALLQELAERFPDRGFSKYYKLIRRRGHDWNHKRVHRVYCALGLNRRRLGKKRLPPRDPAPLAVPKEATQVALSLIVLREVMHHGGFKTVSLSRQAA